MTETEQESFLIAVFRMAAEDHVGCIRLLFRLLNIDMPRDWDYRRPSTHNTTSV